MRREVPSPAIYIIPISHFATGSFATIVYTVIVWGITCVSVVFIIFLVKLYYSGTASSYAARLGGAGLLPQRPLAYNSYVNIG